MANIKELEIEACVPFHWTGEMSDEQAALWARLLLSPVMGIKHEMDRDGYVDNEHGGRTLMFMLTVTGTEAIRAGTFQMMVDSIAQCGGTVSHARMRDIENDEPWERYYPYLVTA